MRFIATADWHAFNFTDFSRILTVKWDEDTLRFLEVEGESDHISTREMNSRLFVILNAICDMRDYAVENNIKYMIMAGDVFHKRGVVETSVYNPIYDVIESFKTRGVETIFLAGNHDQVDSSVSPISSIYGLKKITRIVEKPELITIKELDTDFVFLPYSKDKQFVLENLTDLMEKGKTLGSKHIVLVAHLGVTGGKVGSGMYSMKDEFSLSDLCVEDFDFTILGHYHQPQELNKSKNVIYTGTPVQNSFSDERVPKGKTDKGYNGFYCVDLEKRSGKFVPIVAPRFVTINGVDELSKLDSEFLKNNYVRVKAKSSMAPEVQISLENLSKSVDGVEVRLELEKDYEVDNRSEIGISKSFEDIVKIYAKEKSGLESAHLKILQDEGLKILEIAKVGGK